MKKKLMFVFVMVLSLILGVVVGVSASSSWQTFVLNKADNEIKTALNEKWVELVSGLETDVNNIVLTESDLYIQEKVDSVAMALEQYYYSKLNNVKTSDEYMGICSEINDIANSELQRYKNLVDNVLD